ncbi:MAG TPA: STAS domain-containing protein [Streptosporangiaceae bacterium]|nr:STAS domain-containing protein [Streptosporangiaceae bacterium]
MNSTQSAAAIVTLPAEVDMYNREQAYDQVYAACFSGAYVIIADFTGTRYCDAGGMRRLLDVQDHVASGVQLRFVIPPGHPARRLADLVDPGRRVPVYASPEEAAAGIPVPLPADALRAAGSGRR